MIGSFWQTRTSTVAELNDEVWVVSGRKLLGQKCSSRL